MLFALVGVCIPVVIQSEFTADLEYFIVFGFFVPSYQFVSQAISEYRVVRDLEVMVLRSKRLLFPSEHLRIAPAAFDVPCP